MVFQHISRALKQENGSSRSRGVKQSRTGGGVGGVRGEVEVQTVV